MRDSSNKHARAAGGTEQIPARRLGCGKTETATQSGIAATASKSTIQVARAGEWIEAGELRQLATEQLECCFEKLRDDPAVNLEQRDRVLKLNLDLKGINYLDAGALQILLAIAAELHRRDGRLRLVNASEELHRWFEYAGAGRLLEDSFEALQN
jgi:anti-anti-sigma factor